MDVLLNYKTPETQVGRMQLIVKALQLTRRPMNRKGIAERMNGYSALFSYKNSKYKKAFARLVELKLIDNPKSEKYGYRLKNLWKLNSPKETTDVIFDKMTPSGLLKKAKDNHDSPVTVISPSKIRMPSGSKEWIFAVLKGSKKPMSAFEIYNIVAKHDATVSKASINFQVQQYYKRENSPIVRNAPGLYLYDFANDDKTIQAFTEEREELEVPTESESSSSVLEDKVCAEMLAIVVREIAELKLQLLSKKELYNKIQSNG